MIWNTEIPYSFWPPTFTQLCISAIVFISTCFANTAEKYDSEQIALLINVWKMLMETGKNTNIAEWKRDGRHIEDTNEDVNLETQQGFRAFSNEGDIYASCRASCMLYPKHKLSCLCGHSFCCAGGNLFLLKDVRLKTIFSENTVILEAAIGNRLHLGLFLFW